MKRSLNVTLMLLLAALACFCGATLALAADAVTAVAAAPVPSVLDFLATNKAVILTALLAVSEVLALIPSIKANSIFEAVLNGLKSMAGK